MASHRVAGRKLSRYKDQRKALLRGLTVDLIQHERITTTLAKAKETRVMAEKLITHGKKGTLHNRRIALSKVPNKKGRGQGVRRTGAALRRAPRGIYAHHQVGPPPGRWGFDGRY